MAEYVQVSFKLESEIHDKLKFQALKEKRTQREIIEESIVKYLKENENENQTKLEIWKHDYKWSNFKKSRKNSSIVIRYWNTL